jgi:hypothetical protein
LLDPRSTQNQEYNSLLEKLMLLSFETNSSVEPSEMLEALNRRLEAGKLDMIPVLLSKLPLNLNCKEILIVASVI